MFSKVDSDDAFFGLILDRLIYSEQSWIMTKIFSKLRPQSRHIAHA
jgi:hypothetical protein